MDIVDENKIKDFKDLLYIYNSGLKIVKTKIEILSESYNNIEKYNPIEHIKSRIKSLESIDEKIKRKNINKDIESIKDKIEDIAGIRIICSFANDVYKVAEDIKKQPDVIFISEDDYIKNPKKNGYRSYHMIIKVPVYLVDRVEQAKVEVQIRTEAMDFWASLEHKANYKFNGDVPKHLLDEFKVCSEKIDELDKRMFLIKDIIYLINN
ncbi:MAG: GTP pyrophosphokinase family protein [Clostridia bacterium]